MGRMSAGQGDGKRDGGVGVWEEGVRGRGM